MNISIRAIATTAILVTGIGSLADDALGTAASCVPGRHCRRCRAADRLPGVRPAGCIVDISPGSLVGAGALDATVEIDSAVQMFNTLAANGKAAALAPAACYRTWTSVAAQLAMFSHQHSTASCFAAIARSTSR
ncbi:hypothetical protein [Nocardia sp. CA-119907]|uniref:hypothetical protein n=1 Tax=Nocardia sp. CA-119907 TaxID=3239973 RepID=UPI003D958388